MTRVTTKRLGDILNFKRGYDLPSYLRKEGPYPIISSGGISGYHNEYKVEGEGLVTGRYGTLGQVYYLDEKYWPHNTALYVTDFKGNYPKYVYFLMQCLGNVATSDKSAVPGVNRNELHELQVPYLNFKNQKLSADLLFDLESKIALNNRINTELEGMAKLLYDYWFVQFDFPNEEGQPYKSSGGKMVYNERLKREIPVGWEVFKLEDLGTFKNGINYDPSEEGDTKARIINVRNVSSSSIFIANEDLDEIWLRGANVEKYLVDESTILITRSGTPGATRLIADYQENTIYCGFIICFKAFDFDQKNVIFYHLKNVEKLMSTQSGGTIMKNVSQGTLKDIKVVLPQKDQMRIVRNFNQVLNPIFKKINQIQQENQHLTSLRDWLLPMLINGQVRVGE
ncbi:restriction endonuclease subunit S [Lewinella sp. LCG006]|uniref:restriction endonuclease subunit S n=1 Tax=Lewinella sp. LCG006 TaxID=3231911 RepID=UPI00345F2001